MKRAVIALYVIVSVFAGLILFNQFYEPPQVPQDEVFEIAGTIRPDKQGNWVTIENTDHQPAGISGVTQTNEYIRLEHKVGANKVMTMIVTPDETMARDGYRVGVSAGLDFSIIYIYDKNDNLVNPASYTDQSGNIWIYGKLLHHIEENE